MKRGNRGKRNGQSMAAALSDWDRVLKTPSAVEVYKLELRRLLRTAVQRLKVVLDGCEPPKEGISYLNSSPELNAEIVTALNELAKVRALLWPTAKGGALANVRGDWLRRELSIEEEEFSDVRNAEGRNKLEHFDEYVDRELAAASRLPAPTALPFDLILSHRAMVMPGIGPLAHRYLRVYIATEYVFVNAGHETRLDTLAMQAEQLLDRVESVWPPKDVPGGYVIITVPASR